MAAGARANAPAAGCALETEHALLLDLRAGRFGALQQHAVQIDARIDDQRAGQRHLEGAGFGRREHGVGDEAFRRIVFDQVRILGIGLIGDARRRRAFPRPVFRR